MVGGLRGLRMRVWERGLGLVRLSCLSVSQNRSTLEDEGRGHAGIVGGVPTRNCLGISLRNARIESLFNKWTTLDRIRFRV